LNIDFKIERVINGQTCIGRKIPDSGTKGNDLECVSQHRYKIVDELNVQDSGKSGFSGDIDTVISVV